MGRIATVVAGMSPVLVPLSFGAGDQLRLQADTAATSGGDYGPRQIVDELGVIAAHPGQFLAASYLLYLAALLSIPALLTIWRLAAHASPRWAWAGAVMAALGVVGQSVHLVAYFGINRVLAEQPDAIAASGLRLALESDLLMSSLFAPFFLALVCFVPQAVALRRAAVIPTWACLSVITGTVLFVVVGSQPWSSALWTLLLVVGFAPATAAVLRERSPLKDDPRPSNPTTPRSLALPGS